MVLYVRACVQARYLLVVFVYVCVSYLRVCTRVSVSCVCVLCSLFVCVFVYFHDSCYDRGTPPLFGEKHFVADEAPQLICCIYPPWLGLHLWPTILLDTYPVWLQVYSWSTIQFDASLVHGGIAHRLSRGKKKGSHTPRMGKNLKKKTEHLQLLCES